MTLQHETVKSSDADLEMQKLTVIDKLQQLAGLGDRHIWKDLSSPLQMLPHCEGAGQALLCWAALRLIDRLS